MTNKTFLRKVLSVLACLVLLTAMALTVTGCQNDPPASPTPAPTQAPAAEPTPSAVRFTLTVVDGEGNESAFTIDTEETTVGAALMKEGLIAGEEGQYGLYVKTVNGITADYDTDGTYWAFYIDGEYAMTGVDATEISPGAAYSFKVEK